MAETAPPKGIDESPYENHVLPIDPTITRFETKDVRFPTSLDKTGSDAMNTAGDYSSAYCILHTTSPSHTGHGMTFTIGRGNDLVCAAIPYFASSLLNRPLSSLTSNFGQTWRDLVSDSQIRWVGPEKGVTHLALGAVVNAIWDLWAKVLEKPVWQVVAEMTPAELVRCIDFRYIEDAITPSEAEELLHRALPGKEARAAIARANSAVKAYTTSAGWLGYSLPKMRELLREAKREGHTHFKLKVGGSIEADRERLGIAREEIGYGPDAVLMLDANQIWSVAQAIEHVGALADFKPWFIEEPTSPDDVLGHRAIRDALAPSGIGVASGEMCQNRVMFKQFLQARALDVVQVDACRLGGLNEVLAVLLMARKFGVKVVPHSGGVGLPEYTQHVACVDFVVLGGGKEKEGQRQKDQERGLLEWVDSLHEHFLHPCRVVDGWFVTPRESGYSVEMKGKSLERFEFGGKEGVSWWKGEEARGILEQGQGR